MNRTRRPTRKLGFSLCSAVIVALNGCTTYVEQPARTVYAPQPPPEQPAPPSTYVAPPPVYVAPPPDDPVVVVRTENDFYEPLTPYGEWVVVPSYGRCWRPRRVEAAWHPYSAGHWQRTEAGWYWASDEPWGWATYHYGRWDLDARFGWIWVPQTQWAPAWVSWREGGGYVGWAPLPPTARFGASGEIEVRETAVVPRTFVFVEERRLLEPLRPTTVVVNDTAVINKTVNITKIKVVNKTVINEGPRTDVIERTSGRKIEAVPTRELRHKEEAEVATRQRDNERKAPPAARVEPTPARTVPARDVRSAEKPVERTSPPPTPAPAPSVTKARVPQAGEPKPAADPARPEAQKATRNEKKQDVVTEKAKPTATPAEPKAKQETKSETPRSAVTKKGAQKQLEAQPKSTKEKAGEKGGSDAKKKDQKKKGELPETPAPPQNSPQRTPQ